MRRGRERCSVECSSRESLRGRVFSHRATRGCDRGIRSVTAPLRMTAARPTCWSGRSRHGAGDGWLPPAWDKDRYRCELTVRGDRKSRSAISRSVRPSLASRTIWRCCGVSSWSASGSRGARVTATPYALSSAWARSAHDRAPSRWKVPRASVSTTLASLIRRRRRSHSAWSSRSCARSKGHCSPAGSASALSKWASAASGPARIPRARAMSCVSRARGIFRRGG